MSVTAVISVANHRRVKRARAWLEARDQSEEVLIVGGTLDAANELARNVARAKGAAFGWHRLSLSQLAAVIAAPLLAARGLAPLSRLGTDAIVARSVHRLRAEGSLSGYHAVSDTPGFPQAIAGVIAELRMARAEPEAVAAIAADLAPIARAYEAELKEAGLTDWAGVLAVATEAIRTDSRHRLIGLATLLLDVPVTGEAELRFVGALLAAAPKALLTLPAADIATRRRVDDRIKITVEDLDKDSAGPDGVPTGGLARLQRYLFNEQETSLPARADNEVEIFSAPGAGRECVEIARRVLALARAGVPFDRIAVLSRLPGEYRAHLTEALARADIPAHFARGAVRPDPSGRAFCALLTCAAEGLSARRFAEYLSLGQVPDAAPDGAPPEPLPRSERWVAPDPESALQFASDPSGEAADRLQQREAATNSADAPVQNGQLRAPRRWEALLVEAAVIGGRDRWRRRIEGLQRELRNRHTELLREDEARAASLARTLEDLNALAAYALPLIDELARLPEAAQWGEWLEHLGALATRALRRSERVLALLAELEPMAPVGPVELGEVVRALQALLSDAAVPPASQRYGRVFVGPIEAARGLSFHTVFVPGLAEKMFPHKIVEEPILLDALRTQIDGDLTTNQHRLEHERLALALGAGAAERRVCFSYPRLDLDQARPRVPSFYALEAVRSAEGRLPDFAELARRAETSAAARLGWPAPADPHHAIDDAEYDLTVLDGLMARPEERAGAARYLLAANACLARALRSRYQRWSRGWTSADGLTSRSEAIQAIMGTHALSARSYSPTALQNYARCPYRFFLQAIHGLAPREVAAAIDELDPLQRGSLIHDAQFELFGRLREAGLHPVRAQTLERAHRELDLVLDQVAARYEDELAPAIKRVWQNGIAAIRADLREWLRRASKDDSGFVPWRFELSFGLAHRTERRQADPRSVPGAVDLDCGIQLRGAIDLVERHPSGLLRVTDHKTGKADGKPDQLIAGGKSLQPLLYALAAEKIFTGEAKVTGGRLYFCTSAGGFSEQVVALDDRSREAAVQVADALGDALGRPFLPAAPQKGQCNLCEYRVVCGPYEEIRSARKPQGALDALGLLRACP
jgi:RecB family exonuclease